MLVFGTKTVLWKGSGALYLRPKMGTFVLTCGVQKGSMHMRALALKREKSISDHRSWSYRQMSLLTWVLGPKL